MRSGALPCFGLCGSLGLALSLYLGKHNPHLMCEHLVWCDVWVWASALQPHTHTLTHSHTLLITCTCCYDLTKGTQDKDFSYSFFDSLSIWACLTIVVSQSHRAIILIPLCVYMAPHLLNALHALLNVLWNACTSGSLARARASSGSPTSYWNLLHLYPSACLPVTHIRLSDLFVCLCFCRHFDS